MAHRARWLVVDVERTDAGRFELGAVGDAKIDVMPSWTVDHQALDALEDLGELGDHFVTNFETARSDRGPERNDNITSFRPELDHALKGLHRDLTNGAAPPGVSSSANAGDPIR